jgi:ABC-2 type transport system permease protein
MNGARTLAVTRRHVLTLRRSSHRWFEVLIFPLMDVVLFGSMGLYAARQSGGDGARGAAAFLAGILLFHVAYQINVAVSIGFLEEAWSRNLLNLMTTPLTEVEYLAGVGLYGLARLIGGLGAVIVAAWALYAFNLTSLGLGLVPIVVVLMFTGWAMAMLLIGLVLRFGKGAEILTWGLMFLMLTLSGAFYTTDALPSLLQPLARALPTTQAFIAARTLLDGGSLEWRRVGYALAGSAVLAAAGMFYAVRMLRLFRHRGYITRYS